MSEQSFNPGGGGAPAPLPVGAATEATLNTLLNNLVASQDVEILLVRDTGAADEVVQQIREYDQGTGVWATRYEKVGGAAHTVVGPLEYLDPSAVMNLVLTELTDQGLDLDQIRLDTTSLVAKDFATETTQALVLAELSRKYVPISGGAQMAVTDSAVATLGADAVNTIAGAVAFPIPGTAVGATLTFKGGNAYATNNGLTPDGTSATTVGFRIKENDIVYLGQEPKNDNGDPSELTSFQIIAEAGSNIVVEIEYYAIA